MKTGGNVLLLASFLVMSHQSSDLNLRQLQYVSDHLTVKECRRLITALYQTSFQLKPSQMRPVKDDEPCLLHLADWNQKSGEGSAVEDLCVRLHQIGRVDLARDIARAVYGETAHKIHKYFLDNPFKATAHRKGSRLMEDDDEEEDKTRKEAAVDGLRDAEDDSRFVLAVVAFTLSMTLMTCAVVNVYCSAACSRLCPKRLVATVEAVGDSMAETVATLRSITLTQGLGRKVRSAPRRPPTSATVGPATVGERERLVQSILAV